MFCIHTAFCNISRPEQNGHRFAYDILELIFLNDSCWIFYSDTTGDRQSSEKLMALLTDVYMRHSTIKILY